VPVEKEYRFEVDEGTKTLAGLFDGRSQLLVYHFIFGPECTAGCPTCSAIADCFDGFYHTYSTFDRGTDVLNATWQLLDRTPKGRGETFDGWPRRHDEYPD
jgi:predicted dithiol-disulfide oxidoreductase (DUF899 family)